MLLQSTMVSYPTYFYIVTFILLQPKINIATNVESYVDSEEEEESYHFKTVPTEEEWHMDFMPTGHLPDSIYREMAWYGILQIHPLHHSSKHKIAAQLIWQHTLGRPHVIMESPPQIKVTWDGSICELLWLTCTRAIIIDKSTQSTGKVSRQILAEEAAKWSREQRAAQEVLMENIKSGGNGLTVRTVHGAYTTTVVIIQNGNYYKCPDGSEPDLDSYRDISTLRDRRCTYGMASQVLAADPCTEAEVTPIEYSFHEGWKFCFGNGERENNYFQNGTLDCGHKVEYSIEEVLARCAIDNNIIVTFDYFGDKPRKDMMHNTTLCTSWDPCRLSYLYRLEPPPNDMSPQFPTTPADPCDTTQCPECMEGYQPEDDTYEIDMSDSDHADQTELNVKTDSSSS